MHTTPTTQSSYYKAHFNLGLVLGRPGARDSARIAAARKHFLAALKILPDYPEAHYNLALLFLRDADRERARTHLLAALDTEPEHPGAHGTLRELVGGPVSSPAAYRRVASLLHDQRRFALAPSTLPLQPPSWASGFHDETCPASD